MSTNKYMAVVPSAQNRGSVFPSLLVVTLLVSAPMPSWAASIADDEDDPYEDTPLLTQRVNDLSSSVNIGLRYIGEDAFKFGEYDSQESRGWQLRGGFDIEQRDFEDGTAKYLRAKGADVGSNSGSVSLEGGQQGDHKFRITYKGIEKQLGSMTTPYDVTDPTNQTLNDAMPAVSDGATGVLPYLNEHSMALHREKLGLLIKKKLSPQWNLTFDASSETKQGFKDYGFMSTANFRPQIVLRPVDYTTNVIILGAEYLAENYQLQLGYELSQFDNASLLTTYEDPNDQTRFDAVAQEPSNRLQQLSLNGFYRLSGQTRATAFVAYSQAEQNEELVASSANSADQLNTRSSAEAQVDNLIVRLGLSSKVTDKLTLNAKYNYQDRDDKTAEYIGTYYTADGTSRAKAGDVAELDSTVESLALKGYYRLPKSSKLGLGYEFETIDRPDQNREETDEHKLWASYKLPMLGRFSGTLKLSAADRDGSTYNPNAISDIRTGAVCFRNCSLEDTQRIYDADRKQKKAQFNGQYQLGQSGYVGLMLQRWNDDYPAAAYGLQQMDGTLYTLDFGAQPLRTLSYSLYAGVQRFEYEQKSNNSDDWSLVSDDQALLGGIKIDWEAIPNRLKLNLGYRYMDSLGELAHSSVDATTNAAIVPLPDLETTTHTLELGAEYFVSKQMTLLARAVYEDYQSANWAFDNIDPVADVSPSYLAGGLESPDHYAAMIELGLRYQF